MTQADPVPFVDDLTGYGTATLAAFTFVAVVVALLQPWRAARSEQLRDARKVFGLCRMAARAKEEGGPLVMLYVANMSDDPIFEVSIEGRSVDPLGVVPVIWCHGVHGEDTPYILSKAEHAFNGHWAWNDPRRALTGNAELTYWAWSKLAVSVIWTDGRGGHWQRVGYAEPTRVSAGKHFQSPTFEEISYPPSPGAAQQ